MVYIIEIYNDRYPAIRKYYVNQINEIQKIIDHTVRRDKLNRLMVQLTEQIFDFGRTLLSNPNGGFDIRDHWFKRLVENQDSTLHEIFNWPIPMILLWLIITLDLLRSYWGTLQNRK
jgi:hypothetical protein